MKTEYEGIEISYVEGSNDWHFELRGRSRSAESLAKAKEAIDKQPKEKRTEFPRFQCYKQKRYGDSGFDVVTVTSIADKSYRGEQFWISNGKERSKESMTLLYPVNPHNTALVERIKEKEREAAELDKRITALKGKLQQAEIPESVK